MHFRKNIAVCCLMLDDVSVVPANFVYSQTTTSEAKQSLLAELTSKLNTKSAKVGKCRYGKDCSRLKNDGWLNHPQRIKAGGQGNTG